MKPLSSSAQKFQTALEDLGFACEVVELPTTTRTAKEAARAVGCRVEQIAKSLVFRGKTTGRPLLVVASGPNRVDEAKLSECVAEPVELANPEFVREKTGFVIGGVPPLGHPERLETFLDEDLLHHDELWAAAGTPRAVFKLTPAELKSMTGGRVVALG